MSARLQQLIAQAREEKVLQLAREQRRAPVRFDARAALQAERDRRTVVEFECNSNTTMQPGSLLMFGDKWAVVDELLPSDSPWRKRVRVKWDEPRKKVGSSFLHITPLPPPEDVSSVFEATERISTAVITGRWDRSYIIPPARSDVLDFARGIPSWSTFNGLTRCV